MTIGIPSPLFILVTAALFTWLLPGCGKNDLPAIEIEVRDEHGMPVPDAKVTLHFSRLDWADYLDPVDEGRTDDRGVVALEGAVERKYFVNIVAGERNNRFGKHRTDHILNTGETYRESFSIRPPSEWEYILGGGDHLVWKLEPLMTPQGEPFLDYPVDTDMFVDGRWLDSNGRLGLWWFSEDESSIFYDYATSGAVVESRMISLTEYLFQAEIDFFGIRMLIEMVPVE